MDTYIVPLVRYVAYGMLLKKPLRTNVYVLDISKEHAVSQAKRKNPGWNLASDIEVTVEQREPTVKSSP